jgi:uncharacterized membrane protein
MNLAPLTNAPFAIQLHAYAALAAFVLGAVQLARVKGTTQHRALGYTWVGLMLIVAISSFWIQDMRVGGPGVPFTCSRSSCWSCCRPPSILHASIACVATS